jgi:hypothetical protein
VPPHWAAVLGPQPVVSGRELSPPPLKCGPGLVAMLLGPLVHCPLLHRPLEHWVAPAQVLPLATPVAPCEPFPEPEPEPLVEPPHAKALAKLNESAIAASMELRECRIF